jgi:hypothetical protein
LESTWELAVRLGVNQGRDVQRGKNSSELRPISVFCFYLSSSSADPSRPQPAFQFSSQGRPTRRSANAVMSWSKSSRRWTRLFGENLRVSQLPQQLERIFRTRAFRPVFIVLSDPGTVFGDVASVIDIAVREQYEVVLLTPAVNKCRCPTVPLSRFRSPDCVGPKRIRE